MKREARNCDGTIRGRKSPWYRIIAGRAWDRCPWAELADDPFTAEWLGRYMDTQRMGVRPASLDDLSSREVLAFRTIDLAITDVRRREADAAKKKRERENKNRGEGRGATPRTSPAQMKARAAGKRAAARSKRR